MRIAVGCDHKGLKVKTLIVEGLRQAGHEVHDFGSFDSEPVDYPDIACGVAESLAKQGLERGILICGTGIGMSIAANKVYGVRAALCHDVASARLARGHNDANILCLGGSESSDYALIIAQTFLATEFEGNEPDGMRHARRVRKLHLPEQKQQKG